MTGAGATFLNADKCAQIAGQSQNLITDFLAQQNQAGLLNPQDNAQILQFWPDPAALMRSQTSHWQITHWQNYWQNYYQLWQQSSAAWWNAIQPGQVEWPATALPHDFLAGFIQQSFLLTTRCLHALALQSRQLDETARQRLDFYTQQFMQAMIHSPCQFEVLQATLNSGGDNLIQGLQTLLRDLQQGQLATYLSAPVLGQQIANTEGAVIYQNELMQLIQYAPATAKVWQRPLLFIPPWTSKFYLLDLGAEHSLIKWCVERGFTVFVISWVNPDSATQGKEFADYLDSGLLTALDVIEQVSANPNVKAPGVNTVAYCLGGLLLACAVSHANAGHAKTRITSCTYLMSQLDYEQPSELDVFIAEEELNALNQSGSATPTTTLLRANDLIWAYIVHNYLLGKTALPYELLAWNADAPRLPAKLHYFYLHSFYQDNLLREPGSLTVLDKPVDLSQIRIPNYFLAAHDDHLNSWQSIYHGAALFNHPVRFVLTDSGHAAGILAQHNHYWAHTGNIEPAQSSPEQWLQQAEQHSGSWWEDWHIWIKHYSGAKVAARELGHNDLHSAPGSYVASR